MYMYMDMYLVGEIVVKSPYMGCETGRGAGCETCVARGGTLVKWNPSAHFSPATTCAKTCSRKREGISGVTTCLTLLV